MSTSANEPKEEPVEEPKEPELNRLLAAALDQIDITQYPNVRMTFPDALRSTDLDVWWGASNQLHQLASGVRDALVRDSRFVGEEVRMMRGGLGGGFGFYPNFVDQHLIRRAVMTGSVEGAIQWLKKVLGSTEATGKLVLLLWGVPVARAIELTDDVAIVPFDSLPESDQKRLVNERTHRMGDGLVVSALDFIPPTSALVMKRRLAPIIYDPASVEHDNDDYIRRYELLREIALVLTLVGPRVSLPSLLWFEFDDPDFDLGAARMTPATEIVPTRHVEYPILDPDDATALVRAYLQLPAALRLHIGVAIERINLAQRRGNVGDRAVELATALETLVGDNDKSEMTHKVKVRTVRLLGGSTDERLANAAMLSKAYSIRSSMVHTGRVDAQRTETVSGVRVPVSDIVDRALALCVKLATVIIRRGDIPDWRVFDISERLS